VKVWLILGGRKRIAILGIFAAIVPIGRQVTTMKNPVNPLVGNSVANANQKKAMELVGNTQI